MVREQILQAATDHYTRYGIKSVSMDRIASALRISKKTIYTEFQNKEELLRESIIYDTGRFIRFIEKVESETLSSLEILYIIGISFSKNVSTLCPAFHLDIQRFPDIYNKILEHRKVVSSHCFRYFQKGIIEGDILSGSDYHLIADIYIGELDKTTTSYQSAMILIFLRGLCSEEGRKKLDKITTQQFLLQNKY